MSSRKRTTPRKMRERVPAIPMQWTADKVERVLCNPVYAVNINPKMCSEPQMEPGEWIEKSVELMQEIGAKTFYDQLLKGLAGEALQFPVMHPSRCIRIAQPLLAKFPQTITREAWIRSAVVSANELASDSNAYRHLGVMLNVLEGKFVTGAAGMLGYQFPS